MFKVGENVFELYEGGSFHGSLKLRDRWVWIPSTMYRASCGNEADVAGSAIDRDGLLEMLDEFVGARNREVG